MSSSVPYGQLVPRNIVSSYVASTGLIDDEINLTAVAIALRGKYGRVFPAVVSKARIPIRIDDETEDAPMEDLTKRFNSLFPQPRKPATSPSAAAPKPTRKKPKAEPAAASPLGPELFLHATDSAFQSGENIVAGGKSVAANRLIAYNFIRRVSHDLNLHLRIYNIQTVNIVCSTDLGYRLNVERLSDDGDENGWEIYYIPEEFIGLTWVTYNDGVKVVFVVFDTGKIVATGMKTMETIPIAEARIQQLIAPYRAGSEPEGYVPGVKHMRDSQTLTDIKRQRCSSAASEPKRRKKDNPARRNYRRLSDQVKGMMKQLVQCVDGDGAPPEGELECDNLSLSAWLDSRTPTSAS